MEALERKTPGRATSHLLVLLDPKHMGITVESVLVEERLRLQLCWLGAVDANQRSAERKEVGAVQLCLEDAAPAGKQQWGLPRQFR